MRRILTLFLMTLLSLNLLGCDRRYTQKKIPDYDIENSEIETRRKANAKKPFLNLATVPDRSFDHPTLEDFEDLQKDLGREGDLNQVERHPIELEQKYQDLDGKIKGPFALELVKKIRAQTILAESLEFEGASTTLTQEHKEFLKGFAKAMHENSTDIILIAPRDKSPIVSAERRNRMRNIMDFMEAENINSERLYFGFDDQISASFFPSLDRITEDEIKIFIFP